MSEGYKGRIGSIIRDARKHRGLTQQQLAERLSTSQSAINRIEKGHQNLSLDMLARIGSALDSEIVALGAGPTHLRVTGPTHLSGSIDVKTSKNAGVALLCASLLNRGRTTLRKVARIEEVNRLLEVLNSLGVQTRWLNADNDLEIIPPKELKLDSIDENAARRTAEALLKSSGDLHRAQRYAQKAVQLAGNNTQNLVLLARVYLAAGLKLNAQRELEKAAKLDPRDQIVNNLLREARS